MLPILDFVAVVLATGAIIQVWHQGSIFAESRAKLQAEQDVVDAESWRGRWLELLLCPFCKSYHVPFWLLVFLLLVPALAYLLNTTLGATIDAAIHLVVYALAATRASNILDGLLPPRMRYVPPISGVDNAGPDAAGNAARTPPL